MNDAVRWGTSAAGGVIAIALAVASSLPTPLIVFDKVVVGALLTGGFAALGVSVNIATSAVREARQERLAVHGRRPVGE